MDLHVVVVVEGKVKHGSSEVCSVEVWKCENSGLFRSLIPVQVMQNVWPWMGAVLIPANYDSVWVECLGARFITALEGDTIEFIFVSECPIHVCIGHATATAKAVLPLFTIGQELFRTIARWRDTTTMGCNTDLGCIQCDGLLIWIAWFAI